MGPNTQPNGCISRTVAECKKTNGIITNGLEGRLNQIHEVDTISAAHEQTSGRDMDIVGRAEARGLRGQMEI